MGAGERRDRVELGVGADERGRLARDDVAQNAAADGGRDAEGGGGDGAEAVVERLERPGHGEEPEAGGVEDEQRAA